MQTAESKLHSRSWQEGLTIPKAWNAGSTIAGTMMNAQTSPPAVRGGGVRLAHAGRITGGKAEGRAAELS